MLCRNGQELNPMTVTGPVNGLELVRLPLNAISVADSAPRIHSACTLGCFNMALHSNKHVKVLQMCVDMDSQDAGQEL